jgi:eukaryotic-like serine/threonine-protein kinase
MVGELIAGRYELEELVGTGGMSSVYRARDRLLERRVAIKILHEHFARDEGYVERFLREARSAAKLSHPNIVTVIDRGQADGRQFIVFEYVEGENLKELVERQGRLPVRTVLELGIEIGRALAFAHANGLVHRDVKPQNVLLGNGDVKVTDFGIARSLDVRSGLTQTGAVLGTSDYIAPEQASGGSVDALSDLYSLGVVLYELLAGSPPYSGDSFLAVAMRHVHDPVPSIAEARVDVPLRLDAALQRAMAKDPAGRFRSMEEFVAELETCLRELGQPDADRTVIMAPPRPSPARAQPRRGRRRSLLVPLSALLLGLAAIGAGAAAYLVLRDSGGNGGNPGRGGGVPVHLAAAGAYDPEGDGREHDEEVPKATDGDSSTSWETEDYHGSVTFGNLKDGVGIVFDAGRAVKLGSLTVSSDTPGFVAVVKAGSSATGPSFGAVSAAETVGARTTFSLSVPTPRRYYLLWITRLAPGADRTHVSEVTGK